MANGAIVNQLQRGFYAEEETERNTGKTRKDRRGDRSTCTSHSRPAVGASWIHAPHTPHTANTGLEKNGITKLYWSCVCTCMCISCNLYGVSMVLCCQSWCYVIMYSLYPIHSHVLYTRFLKVCSVAGTPLCRAYGSENSTVYCRSPLRLSSALLQLHSTTTGARHNLCLPLRGHNNKQYRRRL